ncbi:MAG: hypothetical protein ACTS6J_07825 [Burkholderiales bacterium]
MNALDQITSMLSHCGHAEGAMPATALFNKKWMLRLLLDCLASPPRPAHPLSPANGARWFSDGLLATRFVGDGRGDKRAEGFTRADGVIGHFHLESGGHGDLLLGPKATQFVVISAKLEGALSIGAKNASYFDQAARTVACMAHLLEVGKIQPESLTTLAFYLLAPAKRIRQGIFSKQLDKDSILEKVRHRSEIFGAAHRIWLAGWFEPALDQMTISALPWEDLLGTIRLADEPSGLTLATFYKQCLKFSLPR